MCRYTGTRKYRINRFSAGLGLVLKRWKISKHVLTPVHPCRPVKWQRHILRCSVIGSWSNFWNKWWWPLGCLEIGKSLTSAAPTGHHMAFKVVVGILTQDSTYTHNIYNADGFFLQNKSFTELIFILFNYLAFNVEWCHGYGQLFIVLILRFLSHHD